jgi:uncharacterized tellurite resistance protein B-like protein
MNITEYTPKEKLALIDLLVLAMYVDGRLAAAEDDRLIKVLKIMGYVTEYDRHAQFDASVARVRPHLFSVDSAQAQAMVLAQNFYNRERRMSVYQQLCDLIESDGAITHAENNFLANIQEEFNL